MMKFLFDVFQLIVVVKLVYILVKLVFRKQDKKDKKKRKSILGKVWLLATNKAHHYLNTKLRQQKEAMRASKASNKNGKVIQFKKSK